MKFSEFVLVAIFIALAFCASRLIIIANILETKTFPRNYISNNEWDVVSSVPGGVVIQDSK